MQIKNLITETKLVNWQELKDLQPIDLKNHYHGEKVKQSIIKNGFASAIYVWQEPETNDIYIADGHTRSQVLHELYNDGYNLPEKLPCTFIDNKQIKTKKQAIKILLEVFNLKTNPINKDNLIEWLKVEEVAIEEVKIEELHIEEVVLDEEEDKKPSQIDKEGQDTQIVLQYTDTDYKKVVEALKRFVGKTPEQIIFELLGLN